MRNISIGAEAVRFTRRDRSLTCCCEEESGVPVVIDASARIGMDVDVDVVCGGSTVVLSNVVRVGSARCIAGEAGAVAWLYA